MDNRKKRASKTRDLDRTRKTILDVAFWEFYTHGFQGVSIDQIVAKTKLTKGALYHQFPTKFDLGYAVVEEVVQPLIKSRWIEPLEKWENPIEGILYQMQELIGKATPKQLRLGCPLNNLVQEMSPIDAGFRKRLESALNFWISEFERLLRAGKKKGYVQKHVQCRRLATFVVMAHEGFYGLLKGMPDGQLFQMMYETLEAYLLSMGQKPGKQIKLKFTTVN